MSQNCVECANPTEDDAYYCTECGASIPREGCTIMERRPAATLLPNPYEYQPPIAYHAPKPSGISRTPAFQLPDLSTIICIVGVIGIVATLAQRYLHVPLLLLIPVCIGACVARIAIISTHSEN